MPKAKEKAKPDQSEESKVIDYLQKHPETLMSYPDIFTNLSIPHQIHGTISLVERQLIMLRNEKQVIKQSMDELVSIARENEELNQRFHRLALELMSSDQLHDVLSLVQDQVQTFFHTDYVCFKFLPTVNDVKKHLSTHYLDADSGVVDTAIAWVSGRKPICGQQKEAVNTALFGADLTIESSAIIPLYHASELGLLCLGSASKEHFTKEKGTIFLEQLGELVSARLEGLLATE
jgi:uncharacterized protein YigA (DUF484 family)